METCVETYLREKHYEVNMEAQNIIKVCDDWYSNRRIDKFHKRTTVQGTPYELKRLNFAKRCCSDDANLCEVLEIMAGKGQQSEAINQILAASEFNTQYRKQLEKVSALGTAACYIRLDNATILQDGKATGGQIKLNYIDADCFIPLTVENDIVTEAAFSASKLCAGKKRTTLVIFRIEGGGYVAETHIFDEQGAEVKDEAIMVNLGEVKPFAVMYNAEANNMDNMEGYGLPKVLNAIPMFAAVDLCYNVLHGDLDKADKLLLVNEVLCKFDEKGEPITPSEQAKKIFVMLGEKLPQANNLVQEYNPKIRIEEITKAFELVLSLLSMMFGYGTKKYSFENGKITTATEYIGERQDAMQELNKQRQQAIRYIQDICRAVMWYSNTFQGTGYDINAEITVDFDDSYITDKEAELERKRNDALSFDIPELTVWYLMDAYAISEDEAWKMVNQAREESPEPDDETE